MKKLFEKRYSILFKDCFGQPLRAGEIVDKAKSSKMSIVSFKNRYLPKLKEMGLIMEIDFNQENMEILGMFHGTETDKRKVGTERGRMGKYYFFTPLTHRWKNPLEEIKSEMIRIFGMFSSKEKIKEINNTFDEWVQHSQRIELLPKAKKLKPQEVKRKEKFPLSENLIDSLKTFKQLGAIKNYKIDKKNKVVEITRADFLVHKPVKHTQKQLEKVHKFIEDCRKESFKKHKGEDYGFDVVQIEYYKKYFWTGDRSLRPINQIEIIDRFFRDFNNSLNKLHKLLLAFPKSIDQEKINNFVKTCELKHF